MCTVNRVFKGGSAFRRVLALDGSQLTQWKHRDMYITSSGCGGISVIPAILKLPIIINEVSLFPRSCSTHSDGTLKLDENLDTIYTNNEKKLILSIINSASFKELKTLKLNTQSATLLIDQRQQKGTYDSVQELLQVDGLTITSLKKCCDFIIQGPVKKPSLKQVCTPSISDEARKNVNTITAMKVTAHHLVWTQVNKQLQVSNWQRDSLLEEVKWCSPSKIFEMVHNVVDHLPKSDVYVMEQIVPQLKQPCSMVALTTTAAIQATLTSLLNYDFAISQQHRVFSMKPNTLSSHFNIVVGNERVSCLDVISQLLGHNRGNLNNLQSNFNAKLCTRFSQLELPEYLVANYLKEKPSAKDEMGSVLLLALVFHDLVITGT